MDHCDTSELYFNSLAPGRSWCNIRNVIFNLALLIGVFKSSCENVLRWMPQDLTDDESTLVQVIAWCRQATCHYLSQCLPRSLSPYGVIRPQRVNIESLLNSLFNQLLIYLGNNQSSLGIPVVDLPISKLVVFPVLLQSCDFPDVCAVILKDMVKSTGTKQEQWEWTTECGSLSLGYRLARRCDVFVL